MSEKKEKNWKALEPSWVEMDLSHLIQHLEGEILTVLDAVVENDRQCEHGKSLVRQFFANFREAKWRTFCELREQIKLPVGRPVK